MATTADALSITVLVTLWLRPLSSGRRFAFAGPFAMAAFVALQGVAHYVLRGVED